MTRYRTVLATGLIALGLALAACGQAPVEAAHEDPAVVEEIPGSELKRITLTELAAERLDVQTAEVVRRAVNGQSRLVVPYGAVMWDAHGDTWVYTNPETLVYVRAPIVLDRIEGDEAFLLEGPEPGTAVVFVAGPELWGTEHGVGGSGH